MKFFYKIGCKSIVFYISHIQKKLATSNNVQYQDMWIAMNDYTYLSSSKLITKYFVKKSKLQT